MKQRNAQQFLATLLASRRVNDTSGISEIKHNVHIPTYLSIPVSSWQRCVESNKLTWVK